MRAGCLLAAVFGGLLLAPSAVAAPLVAIGPDKAVELISVTRVDFSQGAPPALMLKYRTALRIDDVPLLRREADAVWDRFVDNVVDEGFNIGIVSANVFPVSTGGVTTNRFYNFVFEKHGASWRTREEKAIQQNGLTDAFVRALVARLDALFTGRMPNAVQLYLSDGWSMRVVGAAVGRSDRVLTRSAYVAAVRAGATPPRRQIVNVWVSPDRHQAQVESREYGRMMDQGVPRTFTAHTTERIVLIDDVAVFTGGTREIESLR